MENDMKCPLCGAQLKEGKDCFISCFETDCQCCDGFRKNVYYALISGKKAQDALKEIENILHSSFIREQAEGFMVNWDVVAKIIKEKIASITKGDKE